MLEPILSENLKIEIKSMVVYLFRQATSLQQMTETTNDWCQLHPPHSFAELCLPLHDARKRAFFSQCCERPDFSRASSEREQVHLIWSWSQSWTECKISLQDVADFLGAWKSTISWHLSKTVSPGEPCVAQPGGRPSIIPNDVRDKLIASVQEAFERRIPLTFEDIRDYLLTECNISININTLRKFVSRNDQLRVVQGVPLEDTRLFSSEEDIQAYFDRIREVITVGQIPSGFIFNLDEVGFDSYVDARKIKRIVPSHYVQNEIPTPVSRQEKRATLLVAISADGRTVKPLVVLQRETIEIELLNMGYTADVVLFGRSDTGFMNTRLFLDWAKRSFFPEIRQRRATTGYEGPALLILDGFGVHHSPSFAEMCEEANVVLVFLPPHTSDQLQPCDLGLFGMQKRWQSNITLPTYLNKQTKQVVRIIDSLRMATTPKNVIGAFRKAGIISRFSIEKGQLIADVNPALATSVRHSGEGAQELREPSQRQRVRI